MPGHKGLPLLGPEALDITEIDGADSLYEAEGIIAQSERNASRLFGSPTLYSTEGSSLCIRAMLYLVSLWAKAKGRSTEILAGRNAHKAFLSAASLLDLPVRWLFPIKNASYLSCDVTPEDVESALNSSVERPAAVYLTSPDYLGNRVDLSAIAEVCHRHDVLLLVDNAHGAYLKFLQPSLHPMDLGVDLCCDSAHKTLSVLTGGAYLHLSHSLPAFLHDHAKSALALFGSTSPSYLILQSLDRQNSILADDFAGKLCAFTGKVASLRESLVSRGYTIFQGEPLKLTILPKSYGYTGTTLYNLLRKKGIVCEFYDPDHLVLMLSPYNTQMDLDRIRESLLCIFKKAPLSQVPPSFFLPEVVMSPRDAMLSESERLPLRQCEGRVCAVASVGCPPAVPVVMGGERIGADAVACMAYYGISSCIVVK